MSWKKNGFSYLIWLLYTIVTGAVLADMSIMVCREAELGGGVGIFCAVLLVTAAGGTALLLQRLASRNVAFFGRKRENLTVLGAVAAVVLFAAGFLLRRQGAGGEPYPSEYYEMARVVEGRGVPAVVHGAVYFYLQLLHGIFLLFGNVAAAGVWLQIGLQLAASLLFFLAVRRLAGQVAGLVALGFCMCSPYMVRSCLVLSPETLYFFLLSFAAALMAAGAGAVSCGRRGLAAAFFMGVLAAFCSYVDILGILLLLPAFGIIFRDREGEEAPDGRRKALEALSCGSGALIGFLACLLLDAALSGKSFQGVAGAWFALYQPEDFRLPVQMGISGAVWEGFLLFGTMATGIFSFWFDGRRERISLCVSAAACIMAFGCFGVSTEEMPGFYYLYLVFAVLAGAGLEQCLCPAPEAEAAERGQEAPAVRKEEGAGGQPPITGQALPGGQVSADGEKPVRFLENPLPLPKRHVRREMDYSLPSSGQADDFDYPVAEDDDFDI